MEGKIFEMIADNMIQQEKIEEMVNLLVEYGGMSEQNARKEVEVVVQAKRFKNNEENRFTEIANK